MNRTLYISLLSLSRIHKRLIMVAADLVVLPLALWSAFALRLDNLWPVEYLSANALLFIALPVIGVYAFMRLGLYNAVVRYMGLPAAVAVIKGVALLALLMFAAAYLLEFDKFPRSVPLIFMLVSGLYVGGSRMAMRLYYQQAMRTVLVKEPVIIYGAGEAAAQLAVALGQGREYRVVAFVDDDSHLQNSVINGVQVHSPDDLLSIVDKHSVQRVLLAIPSATRMQRKRVVERLAAYPLHVQTIPGMAEIVAGVSSLDQLRDIDLEDLLGRDPVEPRWSLLDSCIAGKSVLVTGAGGSIGSELCRQIIARKPKSLVLFEMSEFALYSIDQELRNWLSREGQDIPLYPILGSVCNKERLGAALAHYQVETLYHAAAYKHVPMVEHNIFEGIRNNIFGTRTVAVAAAEHGVSHCILISTDKAVRPTNVMGATKRMAELIFQAAAKSKHKTIFSMVRFGNVLGSSGSVVPLFCRQIEEGGPVTVTHPDITRYFMTIPEAAQLVIQAGAMAKGGDVFVLDMGEPVRIADMAMSMIHLSGLQVRDEEHPEGDIEVTYTGLRPGEKLYEELLLGENVIGTEHPKIMRAHEETLSMDIIIGYLGFIAEAEAQGDASGARRLLEQAVRGFVPSSPVVDYLAKTFDASTDAGMDESEMKRVMKGTRLFVVE